MTTLRQIEKALKEALLSNPKDKAKYENKKPVKIEKIKLLSLIKKYMKIFWSIKMLDEEEILKSFDKSVNKALALKKALGITPWFGIKKRQH